MAQSDASVNGGSGQYSYSRNSQFQRKAIDGVKELIKKGIAEKLDADVFSVTTTFQIADLGCAAGPNTFSAVQNIIDSVEDLLGKGDISEIQVFFNDQASNDFNQLFASLPPERRYFAAGVPGSFHGRLFPRESLHVIHSSYSVQILSRVPAEVADEGSPAWNRGRIHYSGAGEEVVTAFEAQYASDMAVFLEARAAEIVHGGLLVFVVPGRPNGTAHSECFMCQISQALGSCLVDLANKGRIKSEKIDSFNLPLYFASPEEIEAAVKRDGSFSIEILETIPQSEKPQPKAFATTMRSGMGNYMADHFELGISDDELFDLLAEKFEESFPSMANPLSLFVLLKRV